MKITRLALVALALLVFPPTRPARADQIKQFKFYATFYFSNYGFNYFYLGLGTIDINTNFNIGTPPGTYQVTQVNMWIPLFNEFFSGGTGYLLPESNGAFLQANGVTMSISAASFNAFWQSGGDIGSNSNIFGVPDFQGGTINPTPEPSTLPLLATGLLGLVGLGAIRAKQIRYQ